MTRAGPGERWMAARGWKPFAFQREVWRAVAQGRSGLLHATTGAGKTYAVWLGMLDELLRRHPPGRGAEPLRALWLTPMRALAADTTRALAQPLQDLAPAWTLGLRTGDTPSSERARQDRRFPSVLVTTPESLSLMLTREHSREELRDIGFVVVDEWHELIGSKRGVQVQLALARLRRFNPALVTWGLSATLGNLEEAMTVLCSEGAQPAPALVRGRIDKKLVIDTLIPPDPGKYSWAGHLGARMQEPVVEEIAGAPGTTLVFTNVRSQAEIWYQLLLQSRPEWAGQIALHHGSLDRATREWVERGLKDGTLRAVVATSSWTWAWTSCRSSACSRSARPRAWRASCSARAAAAMRPAGRAGSRWCPPTRWRSWRRPPPAAPPTRAGWSGASRPPGRWTCWCSTW